MKTNKPRVVCHEVKAVGAPVTLKFIVREDVADEYMGTLSERHPVVSSSPLIRLSDYEALQAECESLRRDAERYRWLRDPCSGAERVVMYCRGDYGRGLMRYTMLDWAIDAAMETQK